MGEGLHLDIFLTCFALVQINLNYIFSEISKNDLVTSHSKTRKLKKQPVDSTIATDNFCHLLFCGSLPRVVP